MKLTEQHLESLVALIAPPDRRTEFAERIRKLPLTDWTIGLDANGGVGAVVELFRLASDCYQLWRLRVRQGERREAGVQEVADAVAEARSRGSHCA